MEQPIICGTSEVIHQFCFAIDCNDHEAYPRGLAISPPRGWLYRETHVRCDPSLGRPWAKFQVKPNEIIHASSLIPTNSVPWVFDFDHYGYLYLQWLENDRRQSIESFDRMLIQSLSNENLLAISAWSNAARNSIEELFARWGKSSPKIFVVYPSVTPPMRISKEDVAFLDNLPPRKNGCCRFLCIQGQRGICSNEERKNTATAMHIVENLNKEGLNVELLIVGGTTIKPIQKGIVTFLPWVSRSILWELIKEIDVFLQMSKSESFGFTLTEAMYLGRACISTSGPSLPAVEELIDHRQTGLLVRFYQEHAYPAFSDELDMNSASQYAKELVLSPDYRQYLGNSAQSKFQFNGKFNIQERNTKLQEIINGRLKGGSSCSCVNERY